MSKTILFQRINFSISTQFKCQKHFYFKQSSLVKQFSFKRFNLVLFNPFHARVDLGAKAMKGCSTFPPKLQHHWNLTIRLSSLISRTLIWGGSYSSAEVGSVHFIAPTVRPRKKDVRHSPCSLKNGDYQDLLTSTYSFIYI